MSEHIHGNMAEHVKHANYHYSVPLCMMQNDLLLLWDCGALFSMKHVFCCLL